MTDEIVIQLNETNQASVYTNKHGKISVIFRKLRDHSGGNDWEFQNAFELEKTEMESLVDGITELIKLSNF